MYNYQQQAIEGSRKGRFYEREDSCSERIFVINKSFHYRTVNKQTNLHRFSSIQPIMILTNLQRNVCTQGRMRLVHNKFLLLHIIINQAIFAIIRILTQCKSKPFCVTGIKSRLDFKLLLPSPHNARFRSSQCLSGINRRLFTQLFHHGMGCLA